MRTELILDSAYENSRVSTFTITLPKFLLQELNTHKTINKNAASSRALPFNKVLSLASFTPIFWSKNEKGMQGHESLNELESLEAFTHWESAKSYAKKVASRLEKTGCHKQIVNRIVEPFTMATVIATSDKWPMFFALRCSEDVEPNLAFVATKMLRQYLESTPKILAPSEWHIPLIKPEENEFELEKKLVKSAARCARVSYVNFYGKDVYEDDLRLHDMLLESKHMSPFEHQVQCQPSSHSGCYSDPWVTYRSTVESYSPIDFNERLLHMEQVNRRRGFDS